MTPLLLLLGAAGFAAQVEWTALPAGSFKMGSDSDPSEKPVHQVSVKAFAIARTPVTFGQYKACVAAGACAPAHVSDGTCWVWNGPKWEKGSLPASFQGDEQPVVCVDFAQAKSFASFAGGRLPSEAEWEYAARGAGLDRAYPWGNENASCERAVLREGGRGCGRDATWPVCSKPQGFTGQGLCDMAGNVWQWTEDWFHESYDGAPADGSAWKSPAGTVRGARGGSWSFDASDLRSAARGHAAPDYRSASFGIRPAKDLP